MKPFVFRLETLLKFRKMQEDKAQVEYLQAVNKLREENDLLSILEHKLNENINLLRNSQNGFITAEMLMSYENFLDKVRNDIKKQHELVVEADNYRLERLSILEDATKKLKLVEKLREKKLQQYKVEFLLDEQKQLDEMGIQIYTREAR